MVFLNGAPDCEQFKGRRAGELLARLRRCSSRASSIRDCCILRSTRLLQQELAVWGILLAQTTTMASSAPRGRSVRRFWKPRLLCCHRFLASPTAVITVLLFFLSVCTAASKGEVTLVAHCTWTRTGIPGTSSCMIRTNNTTSVRR